MLTNPSLLPNLIWNIQAHKRDLGKLMHDPRTLFQVHQVNFIGPYLPCWPMGQHLIIFVPNPYC